MHRTSNQALLCAGLSITMLVAACGGGAATPTPAVPTQAGATSGTTPTKGPAATDPSTGEPKLDAAAEVQAGTEIEVGWTGPNKPGDFITIVKLGATAWTTEDYFNTSSGTPGQLLAPSAAGEYELWYVSAADKKILVRRAIKVLPFTGSLDAPGSVEANHEFVVGWAGPNGPGDYITIVKVGTTAWTNQDYFNTSAGTPGTLLAPIDAGSYELWYVIASDRTVQVRRSITITATSATLTAPAEVDRGAQFQVAWTGPNGPGDYITIVPAGSPPNTYLSYFNTNSGSPGTLTAPKDGGFFEIWYVVGQGYVKIASVNIKVR